MSNRNSREYNLAASEVNGGGIIEMRELRKIDNGEAYRKQGLGGYDDDEDEEISLDNSARKN